MKSYTDIEQTKKLAEIKPIGFEYADFETKKLIAPVFNHFYEKYELYIKPYLDKKRTENNG